MQLCRAFIVAPKKLGNGPSTCSWCNCYRSETHVYKVRPRKDKRGVDLVADALPFGCGMMDRTLPAMQSATPAITADHMML
jgi:hypothetical protein